MHRKDSFLGPTEIRDLARLLNITPTKKLGQNFVHDSNTVRRIVRVAEVKAGDQVVEIGPGLGSLTLGLLSVGARVVVVEIDKRLAAQLPLTVAAHLNVDSHQLNTQLTIIRDDALRITELAAEPSRLVANLPYNISVPVLLHFLEHFASIQTGVVMVQAEVGDRLAAKPGSKVYGGPSIKAAWYGVWRIAGSVSRNVFWPVPNVDSLLVAFTRHSQQPGDEALRRATFALIDAAFQQRRKMLRHSLAPLLGTTQYASTILECADIAPTARGEQLTVDGFIKIARVADDAIA